MVENKMKLKFFVMLAFIVALTGCSKKDEIQALKEQLTKTQDELDRWKRKYNAQSEDLKNARAARRNLGSQLDTVKIDAYSTAQEIQAQYAGYIDRQQDEIERHRRHEETCVPQDFDYLESEIQLRDATIQDQEDIILQQEAAFQEFMDMTGQPIDVQVQDGY